MRSSWSSASTGTSRLWIGERRVTFGKGELGRLQLAVEPPGIGPAVGAERRPCRRPEPLQDAQDLEGDDPAAVGRMGRHADAAVGRGDGLADRRPVLAEVRGGERCAGGREPGRDPLPERAVVERVEPVARQRAQSRGQCGEADELARAPRPAARAPGLDEPPSPWLGAAGGGDPSTAAISPSQAGNPASACSIAGARIASRDSRPQRAWASPHRRTARAS